MSDDDASRTKFSRAEPVITATGSAAGLVGLAQALMEASEAFHWYTFTAPQSRAVTSIVAIIAGLVAGLVARRTVSTKATVAEQVAVALATPVPYQPQFEPSGDDLDGIDPGHIGGQIPFQPLPEDLDPAAVAPDAVPVAEVKSIKVD
jgi:hypothetical protein